MAEAGRKMKLTDEHRKVLSAWNEESEDFGCLCFSAIAFNSGVDIKKIRRIVRYLARKGLTEYHRGLWTECGEMAGAGYSITAAGRIEAAK